MAAPEYTPLPTAPARTMTPTAFAAAADAFVAALPTLQTEGDTLGAYMEAQAAVAVASNLADSYPTVASLLADTLMEYAPNGAVPVNVGDIVAAGGFRYIVVASGGDISNSAGTPVELDVLPNADGSMSLAAFGLKGFDTTDNKTALDTAIAAANSAYSRADGDNPILGVRLVGEPNARYRFSGRVRLLSGVTLDLGRGPTGATLVATSTTGGIEQEGASGLLGFLAADNASFTGPLLELNGEKTTQAFSLAERQTFFDVAMHFNRQANSVGLLMQSDNIASGVARVRGRVDVQEADKAVRLVSNNAGYVNSNYLDITTFDAVENLDLEVNSTGEIAANQITITTQTGEALRSGRVLRCDGQDNDIFVKSWDWTSGQLDTSYSGEQVLLTAASGGNRLRGFASRHQANRTPTIIDLAPPIRRNIIDIDDRRYTEPLNRAAVPQSYLHLAPLGDIHDELAFAYYRYRTQVVTGASVTGSGATPPVTTDLQNIFQPDAEQLSIASATEAIIKIDLGASRAGSDFNTISVAFNAEATKPQKCKVEFSTDDITYYTQLDCGYNGEPMPNVLHRCDGSGFAAFRYVKITFENDVATNLTVARFSILGHGQSVTGGAYPTLFGAQFHGPVDLQREFGGEGYMVNGTKVVGIQLSALSADATDLATALTLVNELKARMVSHGLVAT